VFNQLPPNVSESIMAASKYYPQGVLGSQQVQKITMDRLREYLTGDGDQYAGSPGAFERFKNTDAFSFRMKQLLWDPATRTFNETPEAVAAAEQQVFNELLATGTEKVFQATGREWMRDPAADGSGKTGRQGPVTYEELGARELQSELGIDLDMFDPDSSPLQLGEAQEWSPWVHGSGGVGLHYADKDKYQEEHKDEFQELLSAA
jgi:hypothetical protein